MKAKSRQEVLAFVPAALAASRVGTWETDRIDNQTWCDATTATLFGIDPEAAARGLPDAAFARAIHPHDLTAHDRQLDRVREHGGNVVVEYRTCPAPGVMHWILERGHYRYDPETGGVRGRGIVIDISESKLDGAVEDHAFFGGPVAAETPLERAADHALAARKAIDQIDGEDAPTLRRAIDALLWALGLALAR